MTEEKFANKNQVILSGILTMFGPGKTNNGFPFVNILIRSQGLKYTDTIPCVVYGATAARLINSTRIGDAVTVTGRVREITTNGRSYISIVITSIVKSI
jgi:hypothetical protein